MLRIDITPYKDGLHHTRLTPEAEAVELEPDRFREIEVRARLDCRARRILIRMEVEAVARLKCDRTLKLFDERIEGEYVVLFAPPAFAGAKEREGVYDEVRPLSETDQDVDVTDIVRDTLLLAIPARRIAPEAREMDIQTTYGPPRNAESGAVHPRWDPLKKLLPDEKKND